MKILLYFCFAFVAVHAYNVCPEGWTQWRFSCYRYFNQPRLDFGASETYCHTFLLDAETCPCKHAHLVKVDSSEENDFLLSWWKDIREPTDDRQHLRIGFSDEHHEDFWKWCDGSTGSFTKWDSNQPDNAGDGQHCAVMWKKEDSDVGAWDDEGCGASRAFICEFTL